MKQQPLALVVTPHPLTLQGQRMLSAEDARIEPGETLASLLARHEVLPGSQWHVAIDGVAVPEKHWSRVRPAFRHLIEARRVPEKDALRLIAFAALSYFTFGAGGLGTGASPGLFAAGGAIGGGWCAGGACFPSGRGLSG